MRRKPRRRPNTATPPSRVAVSTSDVNITILGAPLQPEEDGSEDSDESEEEPDSEEEAAAPRPPPKKQLRSSQAPRRR